MRKLKVYIIGGGVAGMTVAHELCKKKINGQKVFDITILEKDPRYVGGKARSIYHREGDFNAVSGNHNYLPGEHGFRFFPGFYCNIYQTFKEIKTENNRNVFQNLVQTSTYMFSFDKNDAEHQKPIEILNRTTEWDYFGSILKILKSFAGANLKINKNGKNNFALALYRMITSNIQRKTEEYERTSWKDFIDADNKNFGDDYSKFFADGLTRSLAAAKSHKTSTRTGSLVFPKMLFEVIAPYGKAGKILNAPTNEAWLNYWERHLNNEGVEYRKDVLCKEIIAEQKVFRGHEFEIENYTVSVVTDIKVIENGVEQIISNTNPLFNETLFVFAIPVEKMAELIEASKYKIPTDDTTNPLEEKELASADNTLKYITDMKNSVDWMCGIVFYLKEQLEFTEGHINLVDSAWAITGLHQDQFWTAEYAPQKFGGRVTGSSTNENIEVKGILSFIMSNCDAAGNGNDRRTVPEMTRVDVIAEAWAQIKNSAIVKNPDGTYRCLTDNDIYIDYNNLEKYIFLDKSLTVIDTTNGIRKLDAYTGNTSTTFQDAYDAYKLIRNDIDNPLNFVRNIAGELVGKEKVDILENDMKLLINSVNTFQCRPASYTKIKNMFLAGDYVRTDVDLATMEGANESGKRAANSVISALKNALFYNQNGGFDKLKYSKIVKYRNPFIRFLKSGLFISIAAVVFISLVLFIISLRQNVGSTGFLNLLFSGVSIHNIIPDFTAPLNWISGLRILQFASQIAITVIFIIILIKHILTRPRPLVLLVSLVLGVLLVLAAWLHPFLFSVTMLFSAFLIAVAYSTMRLTLFIDGFRYRKGRDWQINVLFPYWLLRKIINRLV